MHVFLGDTIVPYTWLLNAALFLALVVVGMLLFIGFFLHRNDGRQRRKAQFRHLFSDLIAETAICDSPEEVTQTAEQFAGANSKLLANTFARKILIRELVKTKDSISGKSAENLRLLFEKLELDKDTFTRFQSGQWHRKASAIQRLAEMQQTKYLLKIYRETNSRNPFVRTEAQIAVVKLIGFKGLRFLSIISHPVSQWQQLSLISHLQEGEIKEEKLKEWLCVKNETVVEFALRLIEIYKCYDLHNEVADCLQHASPVVRMQALQALKEIGSDTTTGVLLQHFQIASRQEQLTLLRMLPETGAGNSALPLLTSLLKSEDEAIRFRAVQAIQKISPAWSSVVIRQIKEHPRFANILSLLQKKAV